MNEWLVTSKTYVRMYLSNNLFCPDKLLVCFYTFLNWHAQTHEEPHEENEKRDRKHFYLAIRNEMFVHRMLWSSNSFSTIPFFLLAPAAWREHMRHRFRCAKPKLPCTFFFCWRSSHLSVRAVQYGISWSAFHIARAGIVGPMKQHDRNEHIEQNYLFDIHFTIWVSRFGFLFFIDTIRFDFWLALDCCSVRVVQQGIKWHRMLIRAARQLVAIGKE